MSEFISRELSGWGRFPVQNCQVTRPEKRRELLEAASSHATVDVIARGLGRSYGDAAINQGSGVILGEKLDRFLDFDSQTGVLHAEGGASFADIIANLRAAWLLSVALRRAPNMSRWAAPSLATFTAKIIIKSARLPILSKRSNC